jgi:predicted HicB family RNase H-like nuclease
MGKVKTKELRLDITAETHRWLKQQAKAEGCSIAALIRQAIYRKQKEEGQQ